MSTHEYWRRFLPWLREEQPPSAHAEWIQKCIQEKGPAPDDLRDEIVALLKGGAA
jgi:hypothetical protein